ncbi:MAG TPA: DUF167 domain-containing protein [Dehalococcoidia bacterium]|nr:DUF167 domain-containing protein [Dehalococcoidia bacterium]
MPPNDDRARIAVRVTPRAGRDAIDGWSLDAAGQRVLRVRVAAAPVDGDANESVLRLLSNALGVRRTSLRIVSGASSRTKLVEVSGVAPDRMAAL